MTDAEAREYETWWRKRHPGDDTTSIALERCLRDVAKRLGIRVQVMYDHGNDGYYFDCGLASTPRAGVLIDEEAIRAARAPYRGQLADLLYLELTRARDQVFLAARKRMTELDGRVAALSSDELSLMHEMYESAMMHEMRSLHASIEGAAKVDQYRALVERFFR